MLLKVVFGLEAANEAVRTGMIATAQQELLERTKPEAVYFGAENGQRTCYVFFDLADPSQIPGIAEPLFQQLGASVNFIPVMTVEDLEKGLAAATG
jgi:hypothetical protein